MSQYKIMAWPACALAVFLMGIGAAATVDRWQQEKNTEQQIQQENTIESLEVEAGAEAEERLYAGLSFGSVLYSENWGLGFGESGTKPTGNATASDLAAYNAWYVDSTEEKVIYLTFDCGYENGNTESILETLAAHEAPATFFIVGNYIETRPDLVQKMVDMGFTVGNHTYHHPDMGSIQDTESFARELQSLEDAFRELTGTEMVKYYRPPQGKYSEENLQMAKDLGYETFFWSLAYVDWYVDDQPTKEEAFSKLIPRIHPGAIVLLHSTSSTNAEILDELLTRWEEMGYTFRDLSQIGKL
jgi:peptidoglycan-N-acetylmuramic acid deacetylase